MGMGAAAVIVRAAACERTKTRRWSVRRFACNVLPLLAAAALADGFAILWLWRWGLWR